MVDPHAPNKILFRIAGASATRHEFKSMFVGNRDVIYFDSATPCQVVL